MPRSETFQRTDEHGEPGDERGLREVGGRALARRAQARKERASPRHGAADGDGAPSRAPVALSPRAPAGSNRFARKSSSAEAFRRRRRSGAGDGECVGGERSSRRNAASQLATPRWRHCRSPSRSSRPTGVRVFANPAALTPASELAANARAARARDAPLLVESARIPASIGRDYRVVRRGRHRRRAPAAGRSVPARLFRPTSPICPTADFFEEAVGQSLARPSGDAISRWRSIGFDQFDAVNEFYGRAVGDALLVEAAQRIGEATRRRRRRRPHRRRRILPPDRGAPGDGEGRRRRALDRIARAASSDPFFVDWRRDPDLRLGGRQPVPAARRDAGGTDRQGRRGACAGQAPLQAAKRGSTIRPSPARRRSAPAWSKTCASRCATAAFCCALQPKVDFRTGAIDGLEVLMRWRDENGVAHSPGQFDRLRAQRRPHERHHAARVRRDARLARCDRRHLRRRPAARLQYRGATGRRRSLHARFADRLAASGQAERFMIELTEEAFLLASQFQLQVAPMLREVGAKISIDDFGVGYSSLSTLAEITADEIKVDRSFITAIHERPRSQSLLRAIESIGEALQHEGHRRRRRDRRRSATICATTPASASRRAISSRRRSCSTPSTRAHAPPNHGGRKRARAACAHDRAAFDLSGTAAERCPCRHCEERSDGAIHSAAWRCWIAAQRSR